MSDAIADLAVRYFYDQAEQENRSRQVEDPVVAARIAAMLRGGERNG